jgi:hypothetical protein
MVESTLIPEEPLTPYNKNIIAENLSKTGNMSASSNAVANPEVLKPLQDLQNSTDPLGCFPDSIHSENESQEISIEMSKDTF